MNVLTYKNPSLFKKQQRNSTIELLRIISMILIVANHYAWKGGFIWSSSDVSISHYWYNLLTMQGRPGVNIFVLISGYFLIESTSINFKRVFKFWVQVFTYSVLFYFIFYINYSNADFSIRSSIKAFFPISFHAWWFASVYFMLYLIHPILNQLLKSLDKKTYQKSIFLFFVLWCLIPSLYPLFLYECNDLLWFIYLYSIAAYLKMYGNSLRVSKRKLFVIFVIFFVITYGSSVIFMLLGSKIPFFTKFITRFFGMQMLPTFIWSLSLFMFIISIKPTYSKIINIIASCTFGVYLIHENEYVRTFLWQRLFDNASQQGLVTIIPHSIICVGIVYLSGTLIDFLRQIVIERPLFYLISRIDHVFSSSFKLYEKLIVHISVWK